VQPVFFRMIHEFDNKQNVVAFIVMAAVIVWGILIVYSIYLWIMMRLQYSKNAGNKAAQEEATKAAAEQVKKNPELFVEGAKTGGQILFQDKV